MNGLGVVVGFDSSRAAESAVAWAASEARLRAVPLTICQVTAASPQQSDQEAPGRTGAGGTVDGEVIALARQIAPGIEVFGQILPSRDTDALLRVAEDGKLLVVGAPAGGPHDGLGSVGMHAAGRVGVPVVVVRGDTTRADKIIVGIDGSPAAEAAAGFAFGEAALRRLPLTGVMSCWVPPAPPEGSDTEAATPPQHHRHGHHETYAEAMTRIAEDRVNQVLGRWQASYPHVAAHPALVTGAPHKALCQAASTAALLVVGSRGLGPVGRTLLGSVSQAVIWHAPCPVAVVPPARD